MNLEKTSTAEDCGDGGLEEHAEPVKIAADHPTDALVRKGNVSSRIAWTHRALETEQPNGRAGGPRAIQIEPGQDLADGVHEFGVALDREIYPRGQ